MYPEQITNSTPASLALKRKRLLLLAAAILFAVAVVIAIVAFLAKPKHSEYTLTKIGLKSKQQFGYLNKSSLYTFNGLAFNETNVHTGTVTTLSSGLRLPVPDTLHWGDSQGALLTFDSSFYYTKVEDALKTLGEPTLYNGSSYTWYLDFKTGTLHLVNKKPIVDQLVHYSARDGGFYYVPNTSDQQGVVTPLHFYDIAAQKDTVLSPDLQVTDMGSLKDGMSPKTVNLIARDLVNTQREKLYSINRKGEKSTLIDADRIFPTNNSSIYIKNAVNSTTDPDEYDITEEPAVLYDITNKTVRTLDFTVGSDTVSFSFLNDKKFYAIKSNMTNDKEIQLYYSGTLNDKAASSTVYSMRNSDKTDAKELIVTTNGFGDDSLLVTTMNGHQELFGLAGSFNFPKVKSSNDAKAIVDSCLIKDKESSLYVDDPSSFHVYFFVTDTFYSSIARFSSCVLQKDSSGLTGYTFQFGGFDPVDGRIVTD